MAPKTKLRRRKLVLWPAAALVLTVCSPGAAAGTRAKDLGPVLWSQYQGGAEHAGVAASNLTAPFERAWTFHGSGTDGALSGAVVAGDEAITVGSQAVYGVDIATGEQRWQIQRAEGPISTPAVAEHAGRVLIYTEGSDAESSRLVAVDPTTRDRLWTAKLEKVSRSGVTVDGDVVFVGDDDATVYAVDLGSGEIDWTAKGTGSIEATLAAAAGKVFVATTDFSGGNAQVRALDAATGQQTWNLAPRGLTFASGVEASGGSVLVGFRSDRLLRSLDPETGRERWSALLSDAISPVSAPARSGDEVYAADLSVALARLDGARGSSLWDFRFNAIRSLSLRTVTGFSSPVVAGTSVIMGLPDGRVVAVDRTSGHLVWETDTGAGAMGPLAAGDGVLLASKAGGDGGIFAFTPAPGGRLLNVPSPTEIDLAKLLGNFAIAFVIVFLVIYVPFRLLAGRITFAPAGDAPPRKDT